MTIKLIVIFAVATIINVILSTLRSLCTINAGKWGAALMNAICYGFYTYVVVLTVSDIALWLKITITAIANFVGVWVVKFCEEKARKDKLWKIEVTFEHKDNFISNLIIWAKMNHISYNYIDIEKYYVVNFYCPTQKESAIVKEFIKKFNGKYFVSESKNL